MKQIKGFSMVWDSILFQFCFHILFPVACPSKPVGLKRTITEEPVPKLSILKSRAKKKDEIL